MEVRRGHGDDDGAAALAVAVRPDLISQAADRLAMRQGQDRLDVAVVRGARKGSIGSLELAVDPRLQDPAIRCADEDLACRRRRGRRGSGGAAAADKDRPPSKFGVAGPSFDHGRDESTPDQQAQTPAALFTHSPPDSGNLETFTRCLIV